MTAVYAAQRIVQGRLANVPSYIARCEVPGCPWFMVIDGPITDALQRVVDEAHDHADTVHHGVQE